MEDYDPGTRRLERFDDVAAVGNAEAQNTLSGGTTDGDAGQVEAMDDLPRSPDDDHDAEPHANRADRARGVHGW